jgi:hypothetical protein
MQACGVQRPAAVPWPKVPLNVSANGTTLYVDPARGSDAPTQTGTVSSPFATISHALGVLRTRAKPRTLILRGGVHFLRETLMLGPEDSGACPSTAAAPRRTWRVYTNREACRDGAEDAHDPIDT